MNYDTLIYGMSSRYDDIICEAAGMPRDELVSAAAERLSATTFCDGRQMVMLDGKPLVSFWPSQFYTESDGISYKLVGTQKYQVHAGEPS